MSNLEKIKQEWHQVKNLIEQSFDEQTKTIVRQLDETQKKHLTINLHGLLKDKSIQELNEMHLYHICIKCCDKIEDAIFENNLHAIEEQITIWLTESLYLRNARPFWVIRHALKKLLNDY